MQRTFRYGVVILLAACCSYPFAAFAQAGFYPAWGFNGAPQAQMLASSYLMQNVVNHHLGLDDPSSTSSAPAAEAAPSQSATAAGSADTPPLIFADSADPIAPAKLAVNYPQETRAEVEQFFAGMLDGYHKIEQQFDIPQNDLGGALAAFVAGSFIAYRDQPFPDELFTPLVRQMRDAIHITGGFEDTSEAEKQELYESLAILGMFMAVTREALQSQSNPEAAANSRNAARGYLQQLKLDPDRLRLTDQGLVLQ
ncbi:MAG: DUF6683 family protein [Alphaproteobacteria bacterium]